MDVCFGRRIFLHGRNNWATSGHWVTCLWHLTSHGIISCITKNHVRRAGCWTDRWTDCGVINGHTPHWHWTTVRTRLSTTHYFVLTTRTHWTRHRASSRHQWGLRHTCIGHCTSIPISSARARHHARTAIHWTGRWAFWVHVHAPIWHWASVCIWCSTTHYLVGSTHNWTSHRANSCS